MLLPLALAGLLAAADATADAAVSPALTACLASGDAARGVTIAMKMCTQAEWQRRDAALNRVYRARMARLSPARQHALRVAQRAWIRHRDATCDAMAGPDSGSLGSLDALDCDIEQTVARTRQLAGE